MKQALYVCQLCGKEVYENYGSGKFCSKSCANTRKHSEITKHKISQTLVNRCTHEIKLNNILQYNQHPKFCNICNVTLPYNKRNKAICGNRECVRKWLSISTRHTKENIGKHILGRHIVYKVVNDFDDRYYIGVRKTDVEFDGYLGSGIHITNMVKHYGKEHFTRLTLFEFDNSTDAFNKEKELLEEALKDPLCVNLARGGRGGPTFKGRHHSLETRALISSKAKARGMSEETRQLVTDKNRQRCCGIPNINKDRIYVTDSNINKVICKEQLTEYLELGFIKGKKPRK